PETVPAGKYARQALDALGVWSQLKPNIIYAKDVRQVLTYVETGNVDAGIVYKTDALASSKVKEAEAIDEQLHEPIIYPVGVVKESPQQEEAILFFEYIQSREALDIMENHGFKGLSK
ncbi:MAG TPA: molybdate ABC transporter substrate-binding protein, partial [Bacillaceae bacterium]